MNLYCSVTDRHCCMLGSGYRIKQGGHFDFPSIFSNFLLNPVEYLGKDWILKRLKFMMYR